MADFEHVQWIQTTDQGGGGVLSDVAGANKGLLLLKVVNANEPLKITCSSTSAAEDVAQLIDGYCQLVNSIGGSGKSYWIRKGIMCCFFLSSVFLIKKERALSLCVDKSFRLSSKFSLS